RLSFSRNRAKQPFVNEAVSNVKQTADSKSRYVIGHFQHRSVEPFQQVEGESGFLEEIAMKRFAAIGVLALTGALTIPVIAQQKAAASPALEIQALSARPEMVSGGDVLLQIAGPANLSAKTLAVRVNGKDVTSAFKAVPDSKALVGLVSGLN